MAKKQKATRAKKPQKTAKKSKTLAKKSKTPAKKPKAAAKKPKAAAKKPKAAAKKPKKLGAREARYAEMMAQLPQPLPWAARAKKHPPIAVDAFEAAIARRNQRRFSTPRPAKLTAKPLSAETRAFFAHVGVPAPLQDFLERFSYASSMCLGELIFNDVEGGIIAENLNMGFANIYAADGLLVVGDGLNGDPIAVDLHTGTVGYLCHDEVWSQEPVDVRAEHAWVDTGLDIGTFFYSAVVCHDSDEEAPGALRFPRDSYETRELEPSRLKKTFANWRAIPADNKPSK